MRRSKAQNVSSGAKSTAAPPYPADGRKRGLKTMVVDRDVSKEAGRASAEGDGDREPLEIALEFIASRYETVKEKIRHGFEAPLSVYDEMLANFAERQNAAERQVAHLYERIAEAQNRRREWEGVTGVSRLMLGCTLAVVFAAQLPADKLAADILPLPPLMRLLVAALAGALTAWAAHFAGEQVIKAKEAFKNRGEDQATWVVELIVLIVVLVTPIALIVTLTAWRGSTLQAFDKATGITDSQAGNIAFAAFAIVAFVVGVIASIRYQPVAGKYQVQAEIRSYTHEAAPLRREIDYCIQARAVTAEGRSHLEEEKGRQLARADRFAGEGMSRAKVLAGKSERSTLRKASKKAEKARRPGGELHVLPEPAPSEDRKTGGA